MKAMRTPETRFNSAAKNRIAFKNAAAPSLNQAKEESQIAKQLEGLLPLRLFNHREVWRKLDARYRDMQKSNCSA